MPEATLAVTTYNRWDEVGNTLSSLSTQRVSRPKEIVIVDDFSKSPPVFLYKDLFEKSDKFITHYFNRGLAAARNTAIQNAEGVYFSFCDDDDTWPQGLLEKLLESVTEALPEVRMAIALSPHKKSSWRKRFGQYPKLSELLYAGVTPPVGSQLYETQMLLDVGGYDERVRSGVDHDLWVTLATTVDPRVAVAWTTPAIVNPDISADRLTTAEKKRREGIEEALGYWKPRLVKAFGEDFYGYFYNAYMDYLDYNFFIKDIKRKQYLEAAKRLRGRNVFRSFIKHALRKASRSIWIDQGNAYNLFPEYKTKINHEP